MRHGKCVLRLIRLKGNHFIISSGKGDLDCQVTSAGLTPTQANG